MPLLDVATVRTIVATALNDADLAALIAREEAYAERRFGTIADGAASRVETLVGGQQNVFTTRPIATVTSVTERSTPGGTPSTIAAANYQVWPNEGRIERNGLWLRYVVVTYVAQDERERWRSALIEVVRHALEQTAMRSENTGGEYQYTAPDWEMQRERLYRRLQFISI